MLASFYLLPVEHKKLVTFINTFQDGFFCKKTAHSGSVCVCVSLSLSLSLSFALSKFFLCYLTGTISFYLYVLLPQILTTDNNIGLKQLHFTTC